MSVHPYSGVERFRYLILAAQREGNRRLAADLAPLGLTPSQSEVLRLLADYGPLTLTGLGELLVCESGTNPSRLVSRLIDAGLVQRGAVARDARAVMLSLTARGHAREAEARHVEERLYESMRDALHDADLTPLVSALESLVQGTPAGHAIAQRNRVSEGAGSA
ncbi:MarR family winged helix-turn-helix transcriptional regulator [Microbacterium lacticum]